MARAAVAAGADGLIIEVHNDPDHALSDGAQSMFPAQFDRLMAELRIIAPGDRPQHLPRAGGAPRLGALARQCAVPRSRAPADRRAGPDRHVGGAGGQAPLARVAGSHRSTAASRSTPSATARRRVVLAAPVRCRHPPAGHARLAARLARDALVIDTGSTKRAITSAAAAQADHAFVGGHPMAGGTRRARCEPGAVRRPPWFLTDPDAPRGGRVAAISSRALGAAPVGSPTRREHDRLMAAVSHLPQVVASALMTSWRRRGRRGQPALGRQRPARHHAAGREPGRHVAKRARDQRRRAEAAARTGRASASDRDVLADRDVDDPRAAVGARLDEATARIRYNQRMNKVWRRRRGGRRISRRRHDHDGRLRALRHSRTPDCARSIAAARRNLTIISNNAGVDDYGVGRPARRRARCAR